jgi:AraC family transcriptional regulator of adaptative response/methylated-DNA-[protein]-cysteine methyltransferase
MAMNTWLDRYQKIEKALRYIDNHFTSQPDLKTVARHVGMSEFHFQRLFSKFVGVSPKKFTLILTAEAARQQLEASKSVLEASLEAGLSGPGRLHDLMIHLHGMTPGEIKAAGAGRTLSWGTGVSPFGLTLVAWNEDNQIISLRFLDAGQVKPEVETLKAQWHGATFCEAPSKAQALLKKIFTTKSGKIDLLARGTPFQQSVWRALLQVPEGCLVSYQNLAKACGSASAVRAVGTAVGANPVAYLIPCHRVIRSTGVLGQYRWGAERKRLLILTEKV